jgi:RluA family pseudouridine synthase
MAREENDDLRAWTHPGVREIYRDDVLWALDKPAGILSHPNPPNAVARNALLRGAYDFERELYRLEIPGSRQRQVHLVHRLDQETSGLILCTFQSEAAAMIKEALFHRELQKEYRALVVGVPSPRQGEWSDRLEKAARGGQATVTVKPGRPNATTRYRVIEVFERARLSLLSLWPETGRTHQLRVQSSSRGHPIAGDPRYGDSSLNRQLDSTAGLKHMFLHAYRVELRHPETGHLLKLEAPLTSRLSGPLQRLRG